jgi:hypothetical protein
MRRAVAAAALLAVAAQLAGCLSLGPAASGAAPPPYVRAYGDDVGAQYDRSFAVPVDARSVKMDVALDLSTKSGGAAPGVAPPGILQLAVLAPDGSTLANATATAQQPAARLVLYDLGPPGAHQVRVRGTGFSVQPGVTSAVGASYELAIEVTQR